MRRSHFFSPFIQKDSKNNETNRHSVQTFRFTIKCILWYLFSLCLIQCIVDSQEFIECYIHTLSLSIVFHMDTVSHRFRTRPLSSNATIPHSSNRRKKNATRKYEIFINLFEWKDTRPIPMNFYAGRNFLFSFSPFSRRAFAFIQLILLIKVNAYIANA